MNNQYDTLLDALAHLDKKGYTESFSHKPGGLYCPVTNQTFTPEQVTIVEFHRFEGNTDMEDMAILYVIETSGNCKGVLVDAFGTYENRELGEFLKRARQMTS